MQFKEFRNLINAQIQYLAKNSVCLFVLDASKDELWDTYIESFRPEDNPIVNENRHYDCNCCKSFIRRFGNVCGIVDGKIVTIWGIPTDIPQPFDVVVTAMQDYLKDKPIKNKFLYDEKQMGVEYNWGNPPTPTLGGMSVDKSNQRFEHFYATTPSCAYHTNVPTELGSFESAHQVVQRSLNELTIESVELVLDIANEGNLARGEQMRPQLEAFIKAKTEWIVSDNKKLLEWELTETKGRSIAIRNTAIGTLLIDLSKGMDVSEAIFQYNKIVDPSKYKRVTPVFTERQRQEASNTIKALGYEDSLLCRHAELSDINVSHVLWANRQSKSKMIDDPLSMLKEHTTAKSVKVSDSTEINVQEFLSILPNVQKLEIMFENKHESNLMNLLTQQDSDAPSILQWNNGFRWSYNGDLAGASQIKQAVKMAGGNVEGVLNFRLAWNEKGGDHSDLDAWATEPSERRIGYSEGYRKDSGNRFSPNGGQLDVDDRGRGSQMHVENITWTKATNGNYKLWVNQFNNNNSQGFVAEVEFDNQIHTFVYNKPVSGNVEVAIVSYNEGKWSIEPKLLSTTASKKVWNLDTQKYYEVNTVMLSPNYWDNKVGNPHYFFFIDKLNNPNSCRSLYNEYLNNDLIQHKRVFEMLGSKLRVESSDNQMCGLGFTTDQKHTVQVKLDGRPYTINFEGKLVDSQVDEQVLQTI